MKNLTTLHLKRLGFFVVMACCSSSSAQDADQSDRDWPRWGGPEIQLVSDESDWESDWSKNAPAKRWEAQVGTGFSSLTIVDGQLYTMGRDGEDQDAVYCLDANSGEEIWRHSYRAALQPRMFEGGPGATPTIADGLVFTLSRQGLVHALKADSGEVAWKVDTIKKTGARQPEWGFTSSALVYDGKVIFDVGCLLALDVQSGEVLWKTRKHDAGYGSAALFELQGKTKICVLSNQGLMVVDPDSGKQEAFQKWETQYSTNATTPIAIGGYFFVSTGYKRGCALFELKNNRFQTVYENKNLSNHMNNSALFEGHLFGVDGNSHRSRTCKLTCIDAKTGEKKWSEMGYGCGSVIIVNGNLIVLGASGKLYCGKASPHGFKPTGSVRAVKGKCWTVPVFLNGKIYCRTADGQIACWQTASK